MIAVDSNILIRYVVKDVPSLAEKATALVNDALSRREPIFVSLVVLVECVWVLKTTYRYPKTHLISFVEVLLQETGFLLENRDAVIDSLQEFRTGRGDVADYLIGQLGKARGSSTTFTFDQGLRGSPHFTVLSK